MTGTFISDYRFDSVAEAIARLEPCPFAGVVTADQVKEVLGVIGDVWPIGILADLIVTGAREAERRLALD